MDGAPEAPSPSGVVATVGGEAITVDRLDRRLAEMRRGPRARHMPPDAALQGSMGLRRWVVQELVTEAVLAHEARAAGIADVTGHTRLATLQIASLVARVTDAVTVDDSEVRSYYERNQDLYQRPERRRVRHFLVADEDAARALVGHVAAGDDDQVVPETRDVRRGELAGPLEEAIFGAVVGAVVGPIQTEQGWHVARVEAVTAAFVVPFAVARRSIEGELLVAARARAFDEWLDRRRAALVVIEP